MAKKISFLSIQAKLCGFACLTDRYGSRGGIQL
jgi:hypothetical protein